MTPKRSLFWSFEIRKIRSCRSTISTNLFHSSVNLSIQLTFASFSKGLKVRSNFTFQNSYPINCTYTCMYVYQWSNFCCRKEAVLRWLAGLLRKLLASHQPTKLPRHRVRRHASRPEQVRAAVGRLPPSATQRREADAALWVRKFRQHEGQPI